MEHISIYRMADAVHALLAVDREPYALNAFLKIANSWVLRALSDVPGPDLRRRACRAFVKLLDGTREALEAPAAVRAPCSPRGAARIESIKYSGCARFVAEWGAEFVYRLVYDERLRARAIRTAARNLAAYVRYGMRLEGPYSSDWLSLADTAQSHELRDLVWKPFMARVEVDILSQCKLLSAVAEVWR